MFAQFYSRKKTLLLISTRPHKSLSDNNVWSHGNRWGPDNPYSESMEFTLYSVIKYLV